MVQEAEKIQKVLARTGYGSRREIERWIVAGRIQVDGKLAVLGDRISAENKVSLDDKTLFLSWELYQQRVLAYYKPEGEICSRSDPEHKKTIFDNLPRLTIGRWIAAGRLDINTTGLILLSNDGQLINRLMHPSHEIEREYAVRVLGDVTDDIVQNLKQGVMLEDGLAKFDTIKFSGGEGANRWFHVVLKEGRNREVRRLWESQGLKVSRLSRVRFGNIPLLRGQKPGKFRDLERSELKQLYQSVGLQYQIPDKQKNKNAPQSGRNLASSHVNTKRGKLLTPKRMKNKKRH
ncbi:MAG: pseudouridine synthase [Gammaproteobacteria bacterium]|nr:pseudouridine synthase [Gammaproteobacteria bacterium]